VGLKNEIEAATTLLDGVTAELKKDKLHPTERLKERRLVRRPVVRIDGKTYFSANKSVLEGLIH
jgi:hypothetical protein